jgi:hypothetical protein
MAGALVAHIVAINFSELRQVLFLLLAGFLRWVAVAGKEVLLPTKIVPQLRIMSLFAAGQG